MPIPVTAVDLPFIATGAQFCGSGGGGSPRTLELMLGQAPLAPVSAFAPHELDPDTPCVAPAFAGSTLLLTERLPGKDVFDPLINVAEKWLGERIGAVCAFEGGGMNALTPFLFAGERTIVDADCSGRAVPTIDRSSLFLDRLPGLFVVCETGAGGVSLTVSDRPADIEALTRASLIQAGGVGAILIGGFTVGDLVDHAFHGYLSRSRAIGETLSNTAAAPIEALADQLGANLVGHGRVLEVSKAHADPHVFSAEISCMDGSVLRLVARSEYLAVLVNGAQVASSPDYIVAIDARTREIVEVTDLSINRHVAVFTLAADNWWYTQPERAQQVSPSSYGLQGLDSYR